MLIMVTGGSGSGKSEFAERCCMELCPGEKIYIATMQPFGKEGAARIQRHKKLRAGKHFQTVECYTGLEKLILNDQTTLLECLSNLAANEMFTNGLNEKQTVEKILSGIRHLQRQTKHLVVVTNDVFCDGISYEQETVQYMKALGEANVQLAAMADIVCEVVCGIPLFLKGNKMKYSLLTVGEMDHNYIAANWK
mgnify:CR=1 FL=1